MTKTKLKQVKEKLENLRRFIFENGDTSEKWLYIIFALIKIEIETEIEQLEKKENKK